LNHTVAREKLKQHLYVSMGVTRLDGAQGKKQFGAPIFEPEVFRKQMRSVEESAYDIVGTFGHPPQSFGSPRSDSAPAQWFGARGIVPSLPRPRYAPVR